MTAADAPAVRPPGRWTVLAGIDGAGKSATSRRVAERMADVPLVHLSHKEIATGDPLVERTMREVADLLWPKIDRSFVRSLPSLYRVHLHAAWYNLFVEYVLTPKLEAGQSLVLDSWYYKFFAHLVPYGYEPDFLDVMFSHVPEPDLVVLLDPPVEAVWGRRTFGPIELGVYMEYPELGRESFIHYQRLIRDAALDLAARKGWSVLPVDPDEPLDSVAARVEALMREVLAPAGDTSSAQDGQLRKG